MIRRTVPLEIVDLGDDEVRIRWMTSGRARDGHILVPEGAVLDGYRKNPIVLWQHNPEYPVGNNENLVVSSDGIDALTRFAPLGTTQKADETRRLVKAGVVRTGSIGFEILEGEPIDPKRPRDGLRATKWELFETSFVSVPADAAAVVTARAQAEGADMAEWKCGAARDLAIDDSDTWDGAAAEKSIFDYAGGDEFDPAKARRGFLFYDADKPKERGSYKDPIAHAVDGELKVPKSAIRAAASRLPQTDVPDDAKKAAEKVLDQYKEKAGIGEERSRRPRRRSRHTAGRENRVQIRGMYGVAQLAYLVGELGYAKDMAEWEKAIEEDDSQVPAMLAACLQQLGETLVAMTVEEIKELLGGDDDAIDTAGLADAEVIIVENAKTPALKRFLVGKCRARAALQASRAGKALSAANAERLGEADGHHAKALEHHRAAGECRDNLAEHCDGMRAAHTSACGVRDDMGEELDSQSPDNEVLRKHCRAMQRHLDAMDGHLAGAADEHEALGDEHRGIGRQIRAAQRSLRAVDGYNGDGEAAGGEGAGGANSQIQKSGGTAEDEGSRGLDYRQRQADRLRLVG